jgi:hypothetical protein
VAAGREGGVEAAGFDPDAAGLTPALRDGPVDSTVRGGDAPLARDDGEVFDGRTGGAGAWGALAGADGVDGASLAHSPSGPAVTIVA